MSKLFQPIIVLFFLFSFPLGSRCQVPETGSIEDPLKIFVGDRVLKDDLWKASNKK